ncbi:helix-turn-helix domain-containing protein [Pseudomonas sp. Wu6]|uniref:helix-turn-helix domain-containing protein n=1 Tax=Pseudomonas sp. Wu6 TaxID=1210129 RepID=UPI001CA6B988|nr:helix-turn-helix domain-containing protein [Pseudomonas sp. Wu6]MBY8931800.1 helix-turn-helix domain-containing protein [Pseudomonas sp. Wu6]
MDRAKGTAALEKAFDVLEPIGVASGEIEGQRLATQLGLPRATMYRLLSMLVDRGTVLPCRHKQ